MKFSRMPDPLTSHELLDRILVQDVRGRPRAVDKTLVLYGAGNLGKMAWDYFEYLQIPVAAVIDANAALCQTDPFWADVVLLNSRDVTPEMKSESLLAVCVTSEPFTDLKLALESVGWKDVVPFYDISEAYRHRHPLSNGWFADQLNPCDADAVKEVLSIWADDVSRAHHLQFIVWHYLREDWMFSGATIAPDNRYFISEILHVLHDHERFVDVGAHHGEVLTRFLGHVQGAFEAIWAIEADPYHLKRMDGCVNKLPAHQAQKIHMIPLALGDCEGDALFIDGLGYASQFSPLGKESRRMSTLDQLGLEPTMIKLHLEGWELAVLQGGVRTLQQCRPVIAVTSYHNSLGIWELPLWLIRNLDDYTFLLRLHSWVGTGCVVYAIPNERCAA